MRGTLCYSASRCFQLRQPAELQMPKPTKTCPFPFHMKVLSFHIPPHEHLHPWMTHRERGAHPAGNLPPWDASKQHEMKLKHASVGFKPT